MGCFVLLKVGKFLGGIDTHNGRHLEGVASIFKLFANNYRKISTEILLSEIFVSNVQNMDLF